MYLRALQSMCCGEPAQWENCQNAFDSALQNLCKKYIRLYWTFWNQLSPYISHFYTPINRFVSHEGSKDTRLLDLTLNITVPFISAGILVTHCTGVFAQRSCVYLSCFGGKVFPNLDESQSHSLHDLSLRSLARYSAFLRLV